MAMIHNFRTWSAAKADLWTGIGMVALVSRSAVHLSLTAVIASAAWAQGTPSSETPGCQQLAQADQLQDFEQQLGPFGIKDQRFTVILNKKRVPGGIDHDSQETLARLEIRDANGTVHFERSFSYRVDGNRFEDTIDASAETLQGTQGTGLLVTYGELPSTPLGGQSWQVFGTFNGKLIPFSKLISTDGQLIAESPSEGVVRTSKEPNFQPEVLRWRIWSGNFFVIVPLRVDWLLAKMSLAWRCSKMTPTGPRSICQYGVEANRVLSRFRVRPGLMLALPLHVQSGL
jgi:hypothetical protein